MTSDEALIGMRVRVREGNRSTPLRGETGTIENRWGNPDYVALDVVLDDGSSERFWHYELETLDASGT